MRHLVHTFLYAAGLAGQRDERDISELPGKTLSGDVNYILQHVLDCTLVLTSAAVSDAIAPRQFAGLVNTYETKDESGKLLNMDDPLSGAYLRLLPSIVGGRAVVSPAGIAANSNQVNTVRFQLVLPLWQKQLSDPLQTCPLAVRLRNVALRWCVANFFGVGQVITSASVRHNVDAIPRGDLSPTADIVYKNRKPTRFEWDEIDAMGRLTFLGLADLAAGPVSSIGATDFATYQLRGQDGVGTHQPQDIDTPTLIHNALNMRDSQYTLPSAGPVDLALLYSHPEGGSIGELPEETSIGVNLGLGAGAPLVTDQDLIWGVIRPMDVRRQAMSYGASRTLKGTSDQFLAAAAQARDVPGRNGAIGADHPMAKYLRRKLPTAGFTG